MNLILICFYYLFFLNSKIKDFCFCSSTKNNKFSNLWLKLKELFQDKLVEKEKNIITYNFIIHNNSNYIDKKNNILIKKNEEHKGFEINHVNRLIYINNFKTYILSAYVPYIYMSVRDIYIVLKKIKELNFNTVYTFLFWPENEYLEDKYDTSNSKLFYLLNFCASNGLFVILNIGPYINNIYNSNIPTYILFNKKVNDYINLNKRKIRNYFQWNIWRKKKKPFIKDSKKLQRSVIEKEINQKKNLYNKKKNEYNKIYSLYFYKRAIKWFNYILPRIKKYTNINNGPIIYLNIDKTFDNYYMYIIIELKRKRYFNNLCKIESYLENNNSSNSILSCIINFLRRIRRSYIITLGYLLYIRFNKYLRVINEYELGLIYINEINKLIQKHLNKINILTTNYPFISDKFINSYAGNNCYNHFLHNNWFDNECIKLNKPCIWSQMWTGAKYSIHDINSPNILKRKFEEHIIYKSPLIDNTEKENNSSNLSENIDAINKYFKGKNNSEKENLSKNDQYIIHNKDTKKHSKKISNNNKEEKERKEKKNEIKEISISVKKEHTKYNNYIGHIRNYKDLTFNILVFLAKGGVFLNIFPYYSGNNINNMHIYLEHYSKETGQPIDLYFNQKEPLYSHIKKIFKILKKYGYYLMKDGNYINPIKIFKNIELYDYDVIKIICNYNIKGSRFVKIGHLKYNINNFSCIIYNEYKKKIIYDSSHNYNYDFSYISKKETYYPIDKYLYSLDVINSGPLMCLKEEEKEKKKRYRKNTILSKTIIKHMKLFSYFHPYFLHSVYIINVLNHYYLTLDFTKFQWYIIKMKNDINYVKLFVSNYSLYIYIYADNKFIYGGFNEYKYIEIINSKNIYIICVNLGLGLPKEDIRTDFFNNVKIKDLKNNHIFEEGVKNDTQAETNLKSSEKSNYMNLNKEENSQNNDGNIDCNKSKTLKEQNLNNKNEQNKDTHILENFGYHINDSEKHFNEKNYDAFGENEYNMHNYYDEESINTFIFIITRNEYNLHNCVGLNGEILKNEKNINEYKKMYNFFEYNSIKPHVMNWIYSSSVDDNLKKNVSYNNNKKLKTTKKDDNNENDKIKNYDNKDSDHKKMNIETVVHKNKIEMRNITDAFLKMCTSKFFSFFLNKIQYYCKTGIFKYLNGFNKVNKENINLPLTWYTLLYFIKKVDFIRSKYSLKLSSYDVENNKIDGLFRGFVYINNHILGSFWTTDDIESYGNEINGEKKSKTKKNEKDKFLNNENLINIPLTRYMRIPTDWLVEGTNVVIIFDEYGGNPYKVEIVREILHGGIYRLTKKEKYVNWFLFLFILSIVIFITYFFFKALHNYFKTKEEKERNKQNYQNIIENIITHNMCINSSYDDVTEETNTENIQNVSDFLDS
ncbi:conserved Plasmodium protein, unknown function [Plasmodium gallinaceum]|uniref:Glycoside hydrolase 35 catalytic domain-containing protein n=1 Tax=Plasmodium gallinaceum TaxID=5849 RepID=A0A1J1GS14_PLAGA|nr:conserved Plasmodium protein, unknown function [Plasmodium gallinaceum]CRG95219.1 conserved Plasmodium protein, unknown function [Plasmodium gallinaceum]